MAALTLFYSYAYEDEDLRDQLEKHLMLLQRQGLISLWHDRKILAGRTWAHEVDTHLKTATIILLLVSPDFLASDYCYEDEMQRALEKHKRGEARVIPIILRPCDWQHAPFGAFQCLPRNGKPATLWDDPDEAFLDIMQGLRRVIEPQTLAHPPISLSPLNQQNRMRLLKRVRAVWIDGLLTQSLYQGTLMIPRLQDRPDVLVNPWRLQVEELNQSPQALPDRTTIMGVYDRADGELLILGEPGAGKTTLLLELTRTLLERAERDEWLRMPIVFHLSSWAEKRQPLSIWLVEELLTKYQVPRKIGENWMNTGQVLPLLDGLDEVAKEVRAACVQAINTYYQSQRERESSPIVVCCRSDEYLSLSHRLLLQSAVTVQPLKSKEQWVQEGNAHVSARKYDEALKAYSIALRLDQSDGLLYYQRGCVFASLLRHDEAISDYDRAIGFSPYFASAYLSKGTVLQQLGKSEQALEVFLQARQLGFIG
jgi:TIR domain/NACHT domain/Tetratricopeptide repeat